MRKSILLSLAFSSVLMLSCINKKAAVSVTNQLYSAVKDGDREAIEAVYPEAGCLPSFYKSDTVRIKGIKSLGHKKIRVLVENGFTNEYGKFFVQEARLYLKPDPNDSGKYVVYDSEGLGGWLPDENSVYKFAVKTGCIDQESDVTDQQIARKLTDARDMIQTFYSDEIKELKSKVTIKNWSLTISDDGNTMRGRAVCVNNSPMTIQKPRYKVTYKGHYGDVIAVDEGYITDGALKSGQSKSFSFHSKFDYDRSRVALSVEIDEDLILNQLTDKDFTGNEYKEYLAKKEAGKEGIVDTMESPGLSFRTFTESRYDYIDGKSEKINVSLSRERAARNLKQLGFVLTDTDREQELDYTGTEYYPATVDTYCLKESGSFTLVMFNTDFTDIIFPRLNDVNEFLESAKACGLKPSENGLVDDSDIYWAGTDIEVYDTKVRLNYRWEP